MAVMGSMCLRNYRAFLQFSAAKSHQGSLFNIVKRHVCNIRSTPVTTVSRVCYHDFSRASGYCVRSHGFVNTVSLDSCSRLGSVASGFNWKQASFYSTQKKDSDGGITSQILKSKLDNLKSSTGQQQDTKQDLQADTKSDSKKDDKKKESWFSSKHGWKLGLISLVASGVLIVGNLVFLWGAPLKDPDGNEIEDEFSSLPKWKGYVLRAKREAHFFKKMIEEPSFKKLLPDPLKEPWYQPPYTLVLELTGVLVHPDWTLGTGWRFKKRPGVQYFLQQVAPPLFEVVIFTHEQGFTAFPIIDGLDPNGHVTFRLFRDATRYMDGAHVKDLDNLNRDLSKVIIVDCDPKAIQKHPRNALLLKKWQGADGDRTLIDLAAFLRTIALSNVEDVRPVLEYYSQFDDPLEAFKENQRRLQAEQEQKAAAEQRQSPLAGFGRSFLRR